MNDNVNITQDDAVTTVLIADDDEDVLELVRPRAHGKRLRDPHGSRRVCRSRYGKGDETHCGFARREHAGAGRVRSDVRAEARSRDQGHRRDPLYGPLAGIGRREGLPSPTITS